MKRQLGYITILLTILTVACGMNEMAGAGSDVSDPIFPRTPSIMPLTKGNAWTFWTTWYDTLGNKLYPSRLDLHITIPVQYGLQDDSTLVLMDRNNAGTKFKSYAYQYEMEDRGIGYLVVYRDLYPLEVRGLYCIGEYDGSTTKVYPQEQLWLAYPADSGKKWLRKTDPLGDTGKVCTMEVLSNRAKFYMLDDTVMTGVSFSDSCYLYKETKSDTVSYYYYDRTIGNLGYLQYVKGVLSKTLLLKKFVSGRYLAD